MSMYILADPTWPEFLAPRLTRLLAQRAELQGDYLTLLWFCFPIARGYTVAPLPHRGGRTEFTVLYVEAENQERPVLYAEVENDPDALLSTDDIDARLRRRFEEFLPECPGQTFYGLSIVGVMVRVYRVDVASRQVTPVQDDWSLDVRTQDAFEIVKGLVSDIVDDLVVAGAALSEEALERLMAPASGSSAAQAPQRGPRSSTGKGIGAK